MKEGYLQAKMSEIDEKLQQMNIKASRLDLQLQSVGRKLEDCDDLLGKLKNLEKFQTDTIDFLSRKNNKLLFDLEKTTAKNVDTLTTKIIDFKLKKISKMVDISKDTVKAFSSLHKIVDGNYFQINRVIVLNYLLSVELVNNGILTIKDINSFDKRATREAQKMLNGRKSKITVAAREKNGVQSR